MSGRAQEVAERCVAKLFSGRRTGNVEVHLGRDEVAMIATASYDIGFRDGRATSKSTGDERVDAARREAETLARLDKRSPTEQREAGGSSSALELAAEKQSDAIHDIAQWCLENMPELEAALVRCDRKGDRPDLAADLGKLLAAWRQAGNAVLAAVAR